MLRTAAASKKVLRPSALAITQRLAQSVFVSDLGVVEVQVGATVLPRGHAAKGPGASLLPVVPPRMAATRDEALDALWPDLNPEAGGNSLHQAIYYLRRVFEPDFREGMSAGYIQVDGEVVSLHPTLVDTASRECWRLLRQGTSRRRGGGGSPSGALRGQIRARFRL